MQERSYISNIGLSFMQTKPDTRVSPITKSQSQSYLPISRKTDWMAVYEAGKKGRKPNARFWENVNNNPIPNEIGMLLLTPSRLQQLDTKVRERFMSPWGNPEQTVDESYCFMAIKMLLLGTPGELFHLNRETEEFEMQPKTFRTNKLSSAALKALLSSFLKPATIFHQLRVLLKLLEQRDLKNKRLCKGLLFLLSEYTEHVHSQLLLIPSSQSLLSVRTHLAPLFREAATLHAVAMSGRELPLVDLPSDRTVLKVLADLCAVAGEKGVVRNLVRKVLLELCAVVQYIIFRTPEPVQFMENLEAKYNKDLQGNFVFSNAPKLVEGLLPDIFQATQALALVQRYAPQLSSLMVAWGGSEHTLVPLTTNRKTLEVAYARVMEKYTKAVLSLEEYFLGVEVQRQREMLGALEQKVQRLRLLKKQVESEQHEKQRIRQMEAFKRMQLEQFLNVQIEEKKTREVYSKQIKVEAEREDLLNRILKEQRDEKIKLLKEIESLGKNIDDEIEKAAIAAALQKYKIDEQAKEVAEKSELGAKVELSETEESNLGAKIEIESSKMQTEEQNSQMDAESVQEPENPLIENNLHELKELAEGARDELMQVMNAQIAEKDVQLQTEPKSPTKKKKGAKTLGVEQEDPDTSSEEELVPAKPTKINQIDTEALKSNGTLSKMEIEIAEFEHWPSWPAPPLSVVVSWWLGRIVNLQERITNKAVIGLLFQEHKLWEILSHLKNIFLCKRGDLVDAFLDEIYQDGCAFSRSGISHIDSCFQAFESRKFPEARFRLTLSPGVEHWIQGLGCLDKRLSEVVKIEFLLKSPVIHLLSENIINSYFSIFSYLIPVRLLHNTMGRQWMELSTRSLRSNNLNSTRSEIEIPPEMLNSCLTLTSTCARVLNEYSAYMYHFCVERAWTRLRKQLFKAATFNRIFKIHKDYLEHISSWISFGGVNSPNSKCVTLFLRGVYDLSNLIFVLVNYGYNYHNAAEIDTKLLQITKTITRCTREIKINMKRMIENNSAVIVTDSAPK